MRPTLLADGCSAEFRIRHEVACAGATGILARLGEAAPAGAFRRSVGRMPAAVPDIPRAAHYLGTRKRDGHPTPVGGRHAMMVLRSGRGAALAARGTCDMVDVAEDPHGGSFGVVLRRYRTVAGLSQEALAERARLSWRAISDLERGVNRTP